jgi:cyclopropane-fatty-acyl-phospholipid synthase
MLNETVKHYDMDIEFFQSFLDPYMKYTSGLFETENDDLTVACQRMLDAIIDCGNIRPGAAVLEVGPGWGSLLKRMHERNLTCDYVGVSPSAVQNQFIQAFALERERLYTSTFEDFHYEGLPLQAIVLIGSFCHLQNKRQQLRRMAELLAADGVIVIEDTFFVSNQKYLSQVDVEATRFVQEKIFGFAEILSFPEQMEQIANVGLKVASTLEHTNSYKYTIDHWIKKLRQIDANRFPDARNFIKYMLIAQRGWNHTTQNHLLVLKKINA